MSNEVVAYREQMGALSPQDVRAQVNLIQQIMEAVMKKDEHYGVIPGTGTKPSLLKAGAEKLCLTFRLAPDYEIEEKVDGPHLRITSKCTLTHIPSGQRFGAGMGSCSTREAKYAFRKSSRKCPNCGAEAIKRSKFPPKGKPQAEPDWYCYAKIGGCGATFAADDQAITGQAEGRTANEDVADQYNTVLKMANKRSLVAAVLNATAASDIFTQDIEDMAEFHASTESGPAASPTSSPPTSPVAAAAGAGPFITDDQAADLSALLSEIPNGEARFKRQAKIGSIAALPAAEYARAVAWAEQARAK